MDHDKPADDRFQQEGLDRSFSEYYEKLKTFSCNNKLALAELSVGHAVHTKELKAYSDFVSEPLTYREVPYSGVAYSINPYGHCDARSVFIEGMLQEQHEWSPDGSLKRLEARFSPADQSQKLIATYAENGSLTTFELYAQAAEYQLHFDQNGSLKVIKQTSCFLLEASQLDAIAQHFAVHPGRLEKDLALYPISSHLTLIGAGINDDCLHALASCEGFSKLTQVRLNHAKVTPEVFFQIFSLHPLDRLDVREKDRLFYNGLVNYKSSHSESVVRHNGQLISAS